LQEQISSLLSFFFSTALPFATFSHLGRRMLLQARLRRTAKDIA
jgi:hypothetical protein